MKKIYIYILCFVTVFYIWGCVEDLTGTNGDKIPPQVAVTTPKTNDTIGFSGTNVSYSASDDQGISFIELYIDSTFITGNHFDVDASGNNPTVKITLDSAKYIGKKISYFLIAYDKAGNSTKSNTMYNIFIVNGTLYKAPPGAPQNLTAKKLSETVYNLSWTDTSQNVKYYEIYERISTSGSYTKIAVVSSDIKNYNVSGINPNGNYYFKVLAVNEYGSSPWSNETSIGGGFGSGNIAAPTNLTAIPLGTKRVKITWQDNSNNENYFQIERKQTWETVYTVVGQVIPNVTSFTDTSTSLQANWEYYYRVKAVSPSNDSSWSSDVYVKTYPYDIAKPTNLAAANSDASTVVLTWSDNDYNEMQTNIERRIGTDGAFYAYDSITTADAKTYTDKDVVIGLTYSYRVRQSRTLTDYTIYSDYSNIATVIISTPPNAPSGLTAQYISSAKTVQLNWTDNSDNETGFIIERRDSAFSSVYTQLNSNPVLPNVTGYFDGTVISGRTYYYRIKAVVNTKSSAYSNEIKINIP